MPPGVGASAGSRECGLGEVPESLINDRGVGGGADDLALELPQARVSRLGQGDAERAAGPRLTSDGGQSSACEVAGDGGGAFSAGPPLERLPDDQGLVLDELPFTGVAVEPLTASLGQPLLRPLPLLPGDPLTDS